MSLERLNAENAWKTLVDRHRKYDQQLVEKNKAEEKKEEPIKNKVPQNPYIATSQESSAALIQRKWRQILTDKTRLVSVAVGKKHRAKNPEFLFFLHNQKIKKSLNLVERKKLKILLDKGDWKEIYNMRESAYYLIITLSQNQEISPTQRDSVLDFLQTTRDFNLEQVYPLLDQEGNFTDVANRALLPILEQSAVLAPLNALSKENFRLLVKALPKSEQMFYLTAVGPLQDKTYYDKGLGVIMIRHDALLLNQERNGLLFMSTGVRNALGIARNGIQKYVASRARLGIFSPAEIIETARNGFRPRATYYPGTKTHNKPIHGLKTLPAEDSVHDDHHSNLWSTLPFPIRAALFRMIDIAREKFKDVLTSKRKNIAREELLSKEIWECGEGNFSYFTGDFSDENHCDESNLEQMAIQFHTMLEIGEQISLLCRSYPLEKDFSIPTSFGTAIFIDMVFNEAEWIKLGLKPRPLLERLGVSADKMSAYQKLILEKDLSLMNLQPSPHAILGYHVYLLFCQRKKEKLFPDFLAWLTKNKQHINITLQKGCPPNQFTQNTIYLWFVDDTITAADCHAVEQVVKKFCRDNQLDCITGPPDKPSLKI